MPKFLIVFYMLLATTSLLLQGCSPAFEWDDARTWGPESNHARYAREIRESCEEAAHTDQSKRIVTVNGVDENYYHTECIPYTSAPPQYMNRMEGR